MLLRLYRFIITHFKKSILILSLIILGLDLIFVAINYFSSREAMYTSLLERSVRHQQEFAITLQMTYRSMLQMSQFISNNEELNQLFLKGKKAVIAEGGGPGGSRAASVRQRLLAKVKPAWDKLTHDFDVRQLHYHLGPGSLSFLRVHKPDKFGDRMDDVRYTIVDTNREHTSRYGFETGGVYSGLRGVSPVWTTDPQNGKRVYVGALESGTSFKQIIPQIAESFNIELAILLTREHVEQNMWPDFVTHYFKNSQQDKYFVEASTAKEIDKLLPQIDIQADFICNRVQLLKKGEGYSAAFYFPLFDYRGTRQQEIPPVGFVLIWEDVSPVLAAFNEALRVNLLYSFFGFLLIEILLIWFFQRELKLSTARREATIDGLTQAFNRRYFDESIARELSLSRRQNNAISIIVCDIDFFKQYNDNYGHLQGDECLKKVAKTLNHTIRRGSDWVARYGGEEFVIVLPGTELSGALMIAENLRKAIAGIKIEHTGAKIEEFVTISLGVACNLDLKSDDDLFAMADRALYRAKENGRNRVEAENA